MILAAKYISSDNNYTQIKHQIGTPISIRIFNPIWLALIDGSSYLPIAIVKCVERCAQIVSVCNKKIYYIYLKGVSHLGIRHNIIIKSEQYSGIVKCKKSTYLDIKMILFGVLLTVLAILFSALVHFNTRYAPAIVEYVSLRSRCLFK